MTLRPLKWLAAVVGVLAVLVALPLVWSSMFGWNWARAPLQDRVLHQTGRALRLDGDLDLSWGWPALHVRARAVGLANPAWAAAPQLVTADAVALEVDLLELLHGRLAFPEVELTQPQVFLEQSGARRTWLFDTGQSDETARIPIGRLRLDRGELSYRNVAQQTWIQASLTTVDAPAAGTPAGAAGAASGAGAYGVVFTVEGRYRGQPLTAAGRAGAVLALRDGKQPYPVDVSATLGATHVRALGTVTSLLEFSALDLQLDLQGDSLAALYPWVGVALPPTPAYRTTGRLLRGGTRWRYGAFTGQIGQSDIAGTLQVDTAGARPLLGGDLSSRRLALADLGPAVGARSRPATTAPASGTPRLLPDLPWDTARWASLDADVTLKAQTLMRDAALPLENLQLHLLLKDAVLTLDPLDFGLAGGHLRAKITLDGHADPLRGEARVQLRGLQLGRLLPAVALSKTSLGELAGDIELTGTGASVGRMLAGADGRVSLVAQDGQISRLMMEKIGLHLLEIAKLTLTGDENIRLHCAVADFGVAHGVMSVRSLVVDTQVTTLIGRGTVDLGRENLDLTIVPHTRNSSLVALRGPVYLRGSFARPEIALDQGRIAARSAGAVALGMLSPLLALVPLFEAGPGAENGCAGQIAAARRGIVRTAPQAMPSAAPEGGKGAGAGATRESASAAGR